MIDGSGVQWIDGGRKSSQFDGQMAMFSGETFENVDFPGKTMTTATVRTTT
jgi:hypothetical protein